jgi:hypothetical protein
MCIMGGEGQSNCVQSKGNLCVACESCYIIRGRISNTVEEGSNPSRTTNFLLTSVGEGCLPAIGRRY